MSFVLNVDKIGRVITASHCSYISSFCVSDVRTRPYSNFHDGLAN